MSGHAVWEVCSCDGAGVIIGPIVRELIVLLFLKHTVEYLHANLLCYFIATSHYGSLFNTM